MDPNTKIFISHSSEDKEEFVRPLAEGLKTLCHIWYDEYSLPYGASIFGSISAGLRDCDFGVVVLSPTFFTKKWTQDEIAGLIGREEAGQKRIIPVLKGVDVDALRNFSSILADRRSIFAEQGVDAVIDCIVQAVDDLTAGTAFVHEPAVEDARDLFRKLGETHRELLNEKEMNESPDVSARVHRAQSELVQVLNRELESIALENPSFRISWGSGEFHCLPNDILWLNVTLPNEDVVRFETTRPSRGPDRLRLDVKVFRPKQDSLGNYVRPDHLEDHRFLPTISGDGDVLWKEGEASPLGQEALVQFFLRTLSTHLKNALGLA